MRPVGPYDEIGRRDCPGPYDVHVVSIPQRLLAALKQRRYYTPAIVRGMSVATSYGTYRFPDVLEVLAIFSEKRVSPDASGLVDTCAQLPFAVCRRTGKSFDLVDAMVNKGFDKVGEHVEKWDKWTERFRKLYEARLKEIHPPAVKFAGVTPAAAFVTSVEFLNTRLPHGNSEGEDQLDADDECDAD